ncbi:gamma-glutamyl-gamma-aminobutyrate hydrolase family protein [Aeromonas hydrophila]|uniref:gamma-glutamyl-gamma-aminobutyrate hydrolase family protein n=1 Tax=Aeromonas hydrophila TaxID=644 RepID=UPI00214D4A5F|nr:gamma-glutamyl-gamma-aminobutyrate hydrolase family protein [Aeromonas hydrophila]MCR3910151.1 gamma-glutamyl-gamma-aminobutyrate hydrolase family protein [Aeromonas hydrophila]
MFKVIVTQRVDHLKEQNESRDALDENLCRWVIAAGGLPFPVSNVLDDVLLFEYLHHIDPDAVILSGGNDIGDFQCRDNTEAQILNWAHSHKVPTLGICRGMQMLITWSGGTLNEVAGHVGQRHNIHGDISASVNSFHRYGALSVPEEFTVIARSAEGCIEAIAHRDWPCEGWMWHPERDLPFSPLWLDRFYKMVTRG